MTNEHYFFVLAVFFAAVFAAVFLLSAPFAAASASGFLAFSTETISTVNISVL